MADELRSGHTYEFICIQVDIANHSKIDAPARVLLEVKRRLRSILDATLKVYADAAPYVRMHWNGDGGAFLIQTHDGRPFEQSIWAAFKIRDDMKSLNREFQAVHELTDPIVLRISMDCGNAIYSDDPGTIHSEMLNKLFKYERDIGTPNQVAITERIYREIKPSLRTMFVERNQSEKLSSKIYVSFDENEASAASPVKAESISSQTPENSKMSNSAIRVEIRVELSDSDWGMIKDIMAKVSFGAGNSGTRRAFVESVVGKAASEQGEFADLIACPGESDFRYLFVSSVSHKEEPSLNGRLLGALLDRSLNEDYKAWLTVKLAPH